MRQSLEAATEAEKDARDSELRADQVQLSYDLVQALRESDRIDIEIQSLEAERDARLADIENQREKAWETRTTGIDDYATVEDITEARLSVATARDEFEAAETKFHDIQEALWKAEADLRDAGVHKKTAEDDLKKVQEIFERSKLIGKLKPETLQAYKKARTDYRKQMIRLDLEKAEAEQAAARKIAELRKQQCDAAVQTKLKVQEAESKYSKGAAAAPPAQPASNNVTPIKPAAAK